MTAFLLLGWVALLFVSYKVAAATLAKMNLL